MCDEEDGAAVRLVLLALGGKDLGQVEGTAVDNIANNVPIANAIGDVAICHDTSIGDIGTKQFLKPRLGLATLGVPGNP